MANFERPKPKNVSPNPLLVEWPYDQYAIGLRTRREAVKAVSRVGTNKRKLNTLLDVLETLKAHAIARYQQNVDEERNAV